MPCGNRRCHRGGYELDSLVGNMVRDGVSEEPFELECEGDEGSANSPDRLRPCMFSIKGTIGLQYKTGTH